MRFPSVFYRKCIDHGGGGGSTPEKMEIIDHVIFGRSLLVCAFNPQHFMGMNKNETSYHNFSMDPSFIEQEKCR